MSNLLEIERCKMVAERCLHLLQVTDQNESKVIQEIFQTAKNTVDDYNKTNRTVIDISVVEDGMWRGNIKKVVAGRFANPLVRQLDKTKENIHDWEFCPKCTEDEECELARKQDEHNASITNKQNAILTKFKKACETTVFPNDLKCKYILFCRTSITHQLNPLQVALKSLIHTEIETVFFNQNQQLIKESHETSK